VIIFTIGMSILSFFLIRSGLNDSSIDISSYIESEEFEKWKEKQNRQNFLDKIIRFLLG